MCVLRQERQRGEHEGRWRGAAVYGVSVGCSSSDRTVNDTRTKVGDEVQRLEEICGAVEFGIVL